VVSKRCPVLENSHVESFRRALIEVTEGQDESTEFGPVLL